MSRRDHRECSPLRRGGDFHSCYLATWASSATIRLMKRGRSRSAFPALILLPLPLSSFSMQDFCLNLGTPVWTNHQVQFSLTGESGVSYVIESSGNLQDWAPVVTNSDFAITRLITVDASSAAS